MIQHFLDLDRIGGTEIRRILDAAHQRKALRAGDWPKGRADNDKILDGHVLALIFEKPSTRTRVSFDITMRQLGGGVLLLDGQGTQLGRGETVADTARVLSRYVDAIMLRTTSPAKLEELARYSAVPVINGLTDASHPCQIIADILTVEEKLGPISNLRAAWIGDGNNVAASWIHAAVRLGFPLTLACPTELAPADKILSWAKTEGGEIRIVRSADEAVKDAQIVITDCWVSMGFEEGDRHRILQPYQVNEALMEKAAPGAIFLHCLPAHRGEEVTPGVIDGPQSVVFDEAQNRVHAQKAILAWCLGKI